MVLQYVLCIGIPPAFCVGMNFKINLWKTSNILTHLPKPLHIEKSLIEVIFNEMHIPEGNMLVLCGVDRLPLEGRSSATDLQCDQVVLPA